MRRVGRRHTTFALVLAGWLAMLGATSARAQWAFRELARNPRIGSRLSAIGVDPRDATQVMLGTEEGTLLVSTDGGLTFDERPLSTSRAVSRSSGPPRIDATASIFLSYDYRLRADPPYAARPASRPNVVLDTGFFSTRPDYFRAELGAESRWQFTPLLHEVVRARDREVEPVLRIVRCGPEENRWVIATRSALFATDDTLTFVQVHGGPRISIYDIRCVADQRLYAATSEGLLVSLDGGWSYELASFDGEVSAMFVTPAQRVFVASGRRVYEGSGLDDTWTPRFDADDVEAPESTIRSVAVHPDGALFMGTIDGGRLQRTPGGALERADPGMLTGLELRDALVAAGPEGPSFVVLARRCTRPQVASTCTDARIFASRDGTRFEEIETGVATRSFIQLGAAAARLYVVTHGELLGTGDVPPDGAGGVDPRTVAWARERLSEEADLETTIAVALAAQALDQPAIEGAMTGGRSRSWAPIIEARFQITTLDRVGSLSRTPIPSMTVSAFDSANVSFMVQLGWGFGTPPTGGYEFREIASGADRAALHTLSRQLAFLAEDAWRERHRALVRLVGGVEDVLLAELLRERVVVLDATLDVLSRSPAEPDADR